MDCMTISAGTNPTPSPLPVIFRISFTAMSEKMCIRDSLYSVAGKGDFVADNAMRIKEMRKEEIREMFVKATREARQSGLWIDEIFTIVDLSLIHI